MAYACILVRHTSNSRCASTTELGSHRHFCGGQTLESTFTNFISPSSQSIRIMSLNLPLKLLAACPDASGASREIDMTSGLGLDFTLKHERVHSLDPVVTRKA